MKLNTASHIFVLVRAFEQSEGDVLELGTGHYSTPMLNWMGLVTDRKIYSYDTVEEWAKLAIKNYSGVNHEIHFEPDLDKINLTDRHWGLVLIDHAPDERRIVDTLRLKDHADFLVLHDSKPKYNHYPDIDKHFKYIYTDKRSRSWTTVVSNFKQFKP
jgi:hypothetical protein